MPLYKTKMKETRLRNCFDNVYTVLVCLYNEHINCIELSMNLYFRKYTLSLITMKRMRYLTSMPSWSACLEFGINKFYYYNNNWHLSIVIALNLHLSIIESILSTISLKETHKKHTEKSSERAVHQMKLILWAHIKWLVRVRLCVCDITNYSLARFHKK